MQTDIDDPRLKLMQKWSQETPEYSVGAEALGAGEDDDESEEDRDGLSSMFLGPPKGGSKANGKLSTNRTKKQKKRAEEAAKKKKKDEKKKGKGKGKSHYSEETLLEHKSGSLSAASSWHQAVWAKLSDPTFRQSLEYGGTTVPQAQRAVTGFASNPTADSYLSAYKEIDNIKKALRGDSNKRNPKKHDRLITVTVRRSIDGINHEVFDIYQKKGITIGAQSIYYTAKLTQDYVDALYAHVKATTKPHQDPPNIEDRRPVRAHELKDLENDAFHQLSLMKKGIEKIFKTFHDSTQKLENKPASVVRNHNPYYHSHKDEDGSHLLLHGAHSVPASGFSSASNSRATSEAGSRRGSFSVNH